MFIKGYVEVSTSILFGSLPEFFRKSSSLVVIGRAYFLLCHLCLLLFLISIFGILLAIVGNAGVGIFEQIHDRFADYFSNQDRTRAIMVLVFAVMSGQSAYNFRENTPSVYGWVEVIVGMQAWAIGLLSFAFTEKDKAAYAGMPTLLSAITSVYIIVRGYDNIRRGTQKRVEREAKRKGEVEAAYLQELVRSASSAASAATAAAQATQKAAEIACRVSKIKVK